MALAPLLGSGAVLELCGGDAVLPSCPPVLRETDLYGSQRAGTVDLRAKLASQNPEARIAGTLAFLEDPQREIAGMTAMAARSPAEQQEKAHRDLQRLSFIGQRSDCSERQSNPSVAGSTTLAVLTETLAAGVGLMRRWRDQTETTELPREVSQTLEAFEDCLDLVRAMPRPLFQESMDVEGDGSSRKKFYTFLETITENVKRIGRNPGAVMVVPCGWLRTRESSVDGTGCDDGHFVFLVLVRQRDTEEFTLGVANAGEGLQYHPVRPSGAPPAPELPLRQSVLVVTGIPLERLRASSFWYLLYRQILYPDPLNGASIMYGTLLPFTNQKPLSANLAPSEWAEFLPIPIAGDRWFVNSMERAIRFCLLAAGMEPQEATWWSSVRLRQSLVTVIGEAMSTRCARRPAAAELALVRVATTSLARRAAEHTDRFREGGKEGRQRMEVVKQLIEKTEADAKTLEVSGRHCRSAQLPPLWTESEEGAATAPVQTTFEGFGRVLREDVEHLKGKSDPPRILIPVLTSTMPLKIDDLHEAAECCRLTANLLALLQNQQDQIAHSAPARFALVTHLVARLLPMPLPVDHQRRNELCFWMRDMRNETKSDIMRHLHLITRHFSAAALALRANRETDGARVCVAGGLAAVMDVLMRRPLDFMSMQRCRAGRRRYGSLLSLHYAGEAGGPTRPFGLDPGAFREASETLLLVAPEYALLRTQVLDYFYSTRRIVADSHTIFKFDRSMACSEGDRTFIEQLGLCLGLDAARSEAHLLITGERPELVELFLELAWFRDVVLLWKVLLLPVGVGVEAEDSWVRAAETAMRWSWDSTASHFVVPGFEKAAAALAAQSYKKHDKSSGWWTALKHRLLGSYSSDSKAVSPASASVLAGSPVSSEDDVLALPQLPSFNNMLRPADSELLLTYLTAPYIRVPLLFGFFIERDRISLLREPQLQAVLDASLFEPGPWQTPGDELRGPPEMVPGQDRSHLSTPAGLLFNELQHSPKVVLDSVISMLRVVVEKDTGRPGNANEGLILYITRLAVRVESYLRILIQHGKEATHSEDPADHASASRWSHKVRGLRRANRDPELQTGLEAQFFRLHAELHSSVFRMLFRWSSSAARCREELLGAACRAHAHMALLYKNMSPEQFTVQAVATSLSSQIFVNMNHRWFRQSNSDRVATSGQDTDLGISEFELLDAFETQRSAVAEWLQLHPEEANQVFEKVERVVTFKGTVEALFPGQVEVPVREWVELEHEPGNFVPRMEAPPAEWLDAREGETFGPWLLRITQGPPEANGQVSVNLGQYKVKREGLQLLPEWVAKSEDYQEAYGHRGVQSSVKEVTTQRHWWELVGHRHEVQRWDADTRGVEADWHAQPHLFGRAYSAATLRIGEVWLGEVLEPVLAQLPGLKDLTLYFTSRPPSSNSADAPAFVRFVGLRDLQRYSTDSSAGAKRVRRQVKEVMVWHEPPLVEVYDIVEYGRQFYRRLAFTSDVVWSFHAPAEEELLLYSAKSAIWQMAVGSVNRIIQPAPSVIIFRQVMDTFGRQMHFPSRFLLGLIPDILRESYKFWRCEVQGHDMLVGDERVQSDAPTRLYVLLSREEDGEAVARVHRKMLRVPKGEAEAALPSTTWEDDDSRPPEILVNARYGMGGLGIVLARLENLSHILVWTDPAEQGVQRAELPRLRLSFTRHGTRLFCNQHTGKWLVDEPCPAAAEQLVAQWGGGTALLQDEAGGLTVLVSAVAEPIRPADQHVHMGPVERFLPVQLVLKRGAPEWVSNLSEGSRHYYYPLHLSGMLAFTPTPAASFYLLLCRFLTWHFADVAAMASAISEVSNKEEQQLWQRLNLLEKDCHADAVACRLRIILAALPYGPSAMPPWDKGKQLLEYVRKRLQVSADCALAAQQEACLLNLPDVAAFVQRENMELRVRSMVLRHLTATPAHEQLNVVGTPQPCPAPVHLGPYLDDFGFDRHFDDSFLTDAGFIDRIAASLKGISYQRLEGERPEVTGEAALRFLDSLFPSNKAGGVGNLHAPFLLLYELFTGTVDLRVVPGDDAGLVASALLRVTATRHTFSASPQVSVLRALEANREVRADMPTWGSEEMKRTLKLGNLLKFDHDSASRLLRAAMEKLRQKEPLLRRPNFEPLPTQQTEVMVEIQDITNVRYWAPPLTRDLLCGSRSFPAEFGEEFGGQPLASIAGCKVLDVPQSSAASSAGLAAVRSAFEQLETDARARTHVGKRTIERLLTEVEPSVAATRKQLKLDPNQPLEPELESLLDELEKLKCNDTERMLSGIKDVVAAANSGSSGDWMRRKCGYLPQVTFSSLVAALMAQEPESSDALQEVSPALTEQSVEALMEELPVILFRAVRIGQISRVMASIRDLLAEHQRGGTELSISLKAQAVALELSAARHFTKMIKCYGRPSNVIRYDPRLLVFEFLFNILLRKTQVSIVGTFLDRIWKGRSSCHQMIMGDGKTTVIAPLLALLLADGQTLVCGCMPASLLDMSRSVMIERFSSPVMPKPVITLHFSRNTSATFALRSRLAAAVSSRAVVVATPTSVKSLLLKMLEVLNQLDSSRLTQQAAKAESASTWFPGWGWRAGSGPPQLRLTAEEEQSKAAEVAACCQVLHMFHHGAILLDEVDLLLDPLRSELNWPMGTKRPLDLVEGGGGPKGRLRRGLRSRLPFHLLDVVFHAMGNSITVPYTDRHEGRAALTAFTQQVELGKQQLQVQSVPHLVVLSKDFYAQNMLPHLADWATLFLESHQEGTLSMLELKALLKQPHLADEVVKQKLRTASDLVLKLLNLTIEWLHHILPHILSKVHRVSYGLLPQQLIDKRTPKSRQLLAVPFIGKDRPSDQSEFSHPDVAIGFTIMAYRLAGMRIDDLKMCITVLQDEMKQEISVRHHRRAACRSYVAMITRAGGTVRGFDREGRWLADLKDRQLALLTRSDERALVGKDDATRDAMPGRATSLATSHTSSRATSPTGLITTTGARAPAEPGTRRGSWTEAAAVEQDDPAAGLWPLELVDANDPEQLRIIFDVIRSEPLAIQYWLDQHVFQANMNTVDISEFQFTASGQELAGPQLFGLCLGFSGTPNDLLPRSMGKCMYTAGVDGAVLACLSNPDVVSARRVGKWSPTELLDVVAHSRSLEDPSLPRYHALIDTGALITGMTNLEVAAYLLRHGLHGLEGVVFLSKVGERMVLVRDGFKVIELAQCGLNVQQRFTFFDHVHTTGMDIKQPLACTACLTLSKDTTFRDYAQGAYRMRGIGKGQQIELLMIPEVFSMVHRSLAKAEGVDPEARAGQIEALRASDVRAWTQHVLVDVVVWVTLAGLCQERRKHQLLCQQNMRNLWMKAASQWLEQAPPSRMTAWLADDRTSAALRKLRHRLDYAVANNLPGSISDEAKGTEWRLRQELHEHLASDDSVMAELMGMGGLSRDSLMGQGEEILGELVEKPDVGGWVLPDGGIDDTVEGDLGLQGENVQEQEQEEEQEEEEEEEQEHEEEREMEIEVETELAVEAPNERNYAREDEAAKPWPLRALAQPYDDSCKALPFYPLGEFVVNKGIFGKACNPLKELPGYLLLSENYYRRSWRYTSVRRLKNLICFFEWVPEEGALRPLQMGHLLSEHQEMRLQEIFELHDPDQTGKVTGQQLRLLLRALDVEVDGEAQAWFGEEADWSLEEMRTAIASQDFYRMQQGRYFVGLCLEEAEHLRAAMHLMPPEATTGVSLPSGCGIVLRSIGNLESTLDDSLVDIRGPALTSAQSKYQLETAEQCFRFTNSAGNFQDRALSILHRTIQWTARGDRLPWWLDVRSCRRRPQIHWEQLPIAKVFSQGDEYDGLVTKALISRMRWAFAALRLWPADAFHIIDTDGDGGITRTELKMGLLWLQLGNESARWSEQVEAAFRFLDRDGDGRVDMDEFKGAFEFDEFDWESVPQAEFPAAGPTVVEANTTSGIAGASLRLPVRLNTAECERLVSGRFRLRWQQHPSFGVVWSTSGTLAERPLSLWAPRLPAPRTTVRVCTGHIASASAREPRNACVLEVEDSDGTPSLFAGSDSEDLLRFVEHFFPHPVRFRKVWQHVSTKPLFLWDPVPPSDHFVALGAVGTVRDQEPELQEVRCVPLLWTELVDPARLGRIWADGGIGSTPVCLWAPSGADPTTVEATFVVNSGLTSQKPPAVRAMPAAAFSANLPVGAARSA